MNINLKSYSTTSSFVLSVNKSPTFPTKLLDTLCKLSLYSLSGPLPRARAITLFLPNKNLIKQDMINFEIIWN